ncbi:MAG: exonuclease SbcCD subunit D, partial [Dehalococcoidales bacterium]|nr:exonuclease SbcCD subunit D [Dehalococcoidales bacterium]
RFITIDVNVEASDLDPTATILHKIAEQGAKTREAIVRIYISLPAEVAGHLRDNDIKNALKETYYFTIAKDIKRQARFRLGQWSTQKITPVEALKAYLESKKTSPERTRVLLEYGEKLMQEQETRQ